MATFGSLCDPRHGTAVRGRATLEALAELEVPLLLISVEEPAPVKALRSLRGVRDAHALNGAMHYGWSVELVRACRAFSEEADVLLAGSAMLLPGLVMGAPHLPIVWDANECETLHYRRLPRSVATTTKGLIWNIVERAAVRRSSAVVTVSETESGYWSELFPHVSSKLHVVAHRPIDRRRVRPPLAQKSRVQLPAGRSVLFVGAISAKHNLAAANWLLENLAPMLPPGTALLFAGPGTDRLPIAKTNGGTVHLLGAVEDLDAVIDAAHVCVAPLRSGAGVKTKVLDYLTRGKPVVCTAMAAEGLEFAPGVEVCDLEDFTRAVLTALDTDETAADQEKRAEAQAEWLSKYHGADLVARQWASVLKPFAKPRS